MHINVAVILHMKDIMQQYLTSYLLSLMSLSVANRDKYPEFTVVTGQKKGKRKTGLLHLALLAVYQRLDTASPHCISRLRNTLGRCTKQRGAFSSRFLPSTPKSGHADSFSLRLAPPRRPAKLVHGSQPVAL